MRDLSYFPFKVFCHSKPLSLFLGWQRFLSISSPSFFRSFVWLDNGEVSPFPFTRAKMPFRSFGYFHQGDFPATSFFSFLVDMLPYVFH